jgi:hypothetical protein
MDQEEEKSGELLEQEIEFDPEKYRPQMDEETDQVESPDLGNAEYEGIPFDPGALELESESLVKEDSQKASEREAIDLDDISEPHPGEILEEPEAGEVRDREEEEELMITLDDFDFEVLENEDEENKS